MPMEHINKENPDLHLFLSVLVFLLLFFYENTLMTALYQIYYK